jgi:hypothetical protein
MNPKRMRTVADLKAALDHYDDELEVYVDDGCDPADLVLEELHDYDDPTSTVLCFSPATDPAISAD